MSDQPRFHGHQHGVGRLLHDRVVHGDRGRRGEGRRVQSNEVEIAHGLFVSGPHGVADRSSVDRELAEVAGSPEDEHAAVPEVVAGLDPVGGLGRIRLLDEFFDDPGVAAPGRGSRPDISVAGFRMGRRHAECHELAGARFANRGPHRPGKGDFVPDDMIRRQDEEDRLFVPGAPGESLERGGGDGGRGVPGDRLQNDGARRDIDGSELFRRHKAVFVVAHHDRGGGIVEGRQPLRGRLQQGILAEKTDQLLGMVFAGQRPESAAGASRENDRDYVRIHIPAMGCVGLVGPADILPGPPAPATREPTPGRTAGP